MHIYTQRVHKPATARAPCYNPVRFAELHTAIAIYVVNAGEWTKNIPVGSFRTHRGANHHVKLHLPLQPIRLDVVSQSDRHDLSHWPC